MRRLHCSARRGCRFGADRASVDLHLTLRLASCPHSTSFPKSTTWRFATRSSRRIAEISTRFDFKGSDARIEHKDKELTIYADDEFKLKQVTDVLMGKLTKRSIDVRSLKFGDPEKMSGDKIKQVVTIRVGVEQELAKKLVKLLKDSKLKVQGSIQGDTVRVSGAKKDLLQEAIALVKKSITDFPLQFNNFRD